MAQNLGRLSNSNTSRFSEGLLISYYLFFWGGAVDYIGIVQKHVSKIWNKKNHTSVASPGKNRRSFSRAADHIFFCWPSALRCLRFHSSRFCCANLAPSWAGGPWSEPFLYSVVYGETYRKLSIFPLNMGLSCQCNPLIYAWWREEPTKHGSVMGFEWYNAKNHGYMAGIATHRKIET